MLTRAQIKRLTKDAERKLNGSALQNNLALLPQWLAQEPDNLSGLWAWVKHLLQAQQRNEAIKGLTAIIKQTPTDVYALALLVDCYSKTGQHQQALAHAKTIDIDTCNNIDALALLAVAYGFADDYPHAAQVFARLTVLQPTNADHWSNLGTMQHYCHNSDDAESALLKAISMDARQVQAYWTLSQVRKASPEKNQITALNRALQKKKLSIENSIYLNFSLGRQLEDLKQYDDAFKHYQQGNDIKREQLNHSSNIDTELFDIIKTNYRPQSVNEDYDQAATPIFISGLPRSGTSLVEQILSAHSDITACGEMHEFYRHMCMQAGSDGRPLDPRQVMQREPAFRYKYLGDKYLSSCNHKRGDTTFFTDKMPSNFLNLGCIAKALPQARLILVRRNALDSIISHYKMLFAGGLYPYSYDLNQLADYYEQYDMLCDFWQEQLGQRLISIRYEELTESPKDSITQLVSRCGIDLQENMLQSHKHKQAMGTASAGQVRQAIYKSSVNAWQRYEQQIPSLIKRFTS